MEKKEPKSCTVYMQLPEEVMPQADIQKLIESSKIEDKCRGLQNLVLNIINDDLFPRMIMNVITNVLPMQNESHSIKKVLFFYWEVIEKVNVNNQLKDEMILVCNSLRNDLLHANEFIRGRTLKLVSRMMYKGMLEALQIAIVENISHKHQFVRKNAVSCLQSIYEAFGLELISEIPDLMLNLISIESDITVKRNAFTLLSICDYSKAFTYVNSLFFNGEPEESLGDIFLISVLNMIKNNYSKQKQDRQTLIKILTHISQSKSYAVQLESANTIIEITAQEILIRQASSIYIQILLAYNDNNVKLILLEKLKVIQDINRKALEDNIVDIATLLSNQSVDIKAKVLELLKAAIAKKNVCVLVEIIAKEISKLAKSGQIGQITPLLETINDLQLQFKETHLILYPLILELLNQKLEDPQALLLKGMLINILSQDKNKIGDLLKKFRDIQNIYCYKAILYIFSHLLEDKANVGMAFLEIKKALGSIPFEIKQIKEEENKVEKKQRIKTVILPDGTYGNQIIEDTDQTKTEVASLFRELIMNFSFLGSQLAYTLLSLLNKVDLITNDFNRYKVEILLILCALIRYYQSNSSKVDQESINRIQTCVKILANNNQQVKQQISQLIQQKEYHQQITYQIQEQQPIFTIQKQVDELIYFRQVRPNSKEYDDEPIAVQHSWELDYGKKLATLVQLTGYSDPIYAETFVQINKYDIQFDVFMVNRSGKTLQNIHIEFSTQNDVKVLEKAPPVTLQSGQTCQIKTSIKFSSADVGIIYGTINYESTAGIEQPYIVSKEIVIDLIDFIYPANIDIDTFRKLWAKYEWENKFNIVTNINDLNDFVAHIESRLNMKQVVAQNEKEINCICANLYGMTRLDEDILINISGEKLSNRISGCIRIRCKTKGMVVNLGEKIKSMQQKIE